MVVDSIAHKGDRTMNDQMKRISKLIGVLDDRFSLLKEWSEKASPEEGDLKIVESVETHLNALIQMIDYITVD